MEIREGGLDEPEVIDLLRVHLDEVRGQRTPGGAHVLDREGLKRPDVSFWTAWRGEALLGCGAIRQLDAAHGEIKSMRTAPDQLRRGAGIGLMAHMLGVARERGYKRLSLETGATPEFDAAQALYRQLGFTYCEPFGEYRADPLSRFMSRAL
jgi:putative acetyltransferase